MEQATMEKIEKLRDILKSMDSALVAYSGGVDSTLLLKTALDVLGPGKVAAFIVSSQVHPEWETSEAHCMAEKLGARIIDLNQDILLIPTFRENKEDRCYHCKREMLAAAMAHAREKGYKYVIEGANADDAKDWRPGLKAVKEIGARSPLLEVGLTKNEIREASKDMGLSTWDKPSMACLATRFPHRVEITPERLEQVGACENALRNEGLKQVRVRYHGNLARIEAHVGEFNKIFKDQARERIVEAFKKAGFKYISLDLEGYRTGSMNPG